jgi:hypothetical protein
METIEKQSKNNRKTIEKQSKNNRKTILDTQFYRRLLLQR